MRTSLLVLTTVLLGCGGAQAQTDPNAVAVTRQDLDLLRRLAREVHSLRAENTALKRRLDFVEQRVGLARFRPSKLKPVHGVEVKPKDAVRVVEAGARGKRANLGKYLGTYDGYVVAFWATWCKPCTSPEELAHLRMLQTRLRKSRIELVSVLIDDLKKAQADPRASGWLYPFWFREDAHIDMLPQAFIQRVGLNLPLFLVVSPSGEVRYVHNEKLTDDAVRDIVTATTNMCRI